MPYTPSSVGRRERNKQEKLGRILDAASELFAERGIDDVTTQQIADRADIGTGTLFLYAKSKGELLLMVQNAHYREALERGAAEAAGIPDTAGAIMAIVGAVVECNRIQVDNGRAYLREIVFGDPEDEHHRAALDLSADTEAAIASILLRTPDATASDAAARARVVSAVMFTTLAIGANRHATVGELLAQIRALLGAVLPR